MYVNVGVLVFTVTCNVLGRVKLSTVGFVCHWRREFFSGWNVCERACSRHPSLEDNTVQCGALTCSSHRSTYSSSQLSSLEATRVPIKHICRFSVCYADLDPQYIILKHLFLHIYFLFKPFLIIVLLEYL